MIKRIIIFLRHLAIIGRWRFWFFYVGAVIIVLIPAVSIRLANHSELKKELTSLTLSRRENIAVPVAKALSEELHRLVDFMTTLAIHPKIREYVKNGEWDQAITVADTNVKLAVLPLVDRVFLADAKGILQADNPALPGVRGQDFSYREWFTSVMSTGKPAVTSVYKRTVQPQINVVAVAAPVTNDTNETIGVVVIQIKLSELLTWLSDISVGDHSFVYVVDRRGQIVAHPKYTPQDPIINYSSVPAVRNVLRGQTGAIVAYDPIEKEEHLTAYAPVAQTGWGVLVQEPTASAFAAPQRTLAKFTQLEALGAVWNIFVLIVLLSIIHRLMQYLFVHHLSHHVTPIKKSGQKKPSKTSDQA